MKLKQLQKFYDIINIKVFDSELPTVKLALSKKDRDLYGLCYFEWYKGQAVNKAKITIYYETIARDYSESADEILRVLVHEMVHLWVIFSAGRDINRTTNLALRHDKVLFSAFGNRAYTEGIISNPDLLE